jgi:hypothetical protein
MHTNTYVYTHTYTHTHTHPHTHSHTHTPTHPHTHKHTHTHTHTYTHIQLEESSGIATMVLNDLINHDKIVMGSLSMELSLVSDYIYT